jgi:hypothetical protein
VLRRVSESKTEDVTGKWRNYGSIMKNFLICTLRKRLSGNQIKDDKMNRTCSMRRERKYAHDTLFLKPEWKRPLGSKHRGGGGGNIKVEPK